MAVRGTACEWRDEAYPSGYRFALAEMKVVLFVLLLRFKFEILPSRPEITRRDL